MRFLDTNVLLYSVGTDPSEAHQRAVSLDLLTETHNALSVQVLQEFYVQATRVTRRDALTHPQAVNLIHSWLRFPVLDVTKALLLRALELKKDHQLSYWHGAIVAAAQALQCRFLYTEDLNHGQVFGGVEVVNPFREQDSPPAPE